MNAAILLFCATAGALAISAACMHCTRRHSCEI
jgi:hypothetical protein